VRLVDTHTHLSDPRFAPDRSQVLDRARAAGLVHMLDVGADLKSSENCVALAEATAGVWAVVGVHPHEAESLDEPALARLRSLAGRRKVVAIGETGLDFYRNLAMPDHQRLAFEQHLALAAEAGKAVVIHSRQAYDETMDVLASWAGRVRPVLHCFSGDSEQVHRALELGCMISFAGPLTYPGSIELRKAAAEVPAEQLLLETDCPYLAPQARRGRRNEPGYLAMTAVALAEVRGVDVEELSEITSANAENTFGLS
jgi:TatD DNase family protein